MEAEVSGRDMHGCRWEEMEGSPAPLGVRWIPEGRAYNFALYSKYADRVKLLFYTGDEFYEPASTFEFDPFVNKTGRIWHARIPLSQITQAKYYAYSVSGPEPSGERFERHRFDPQKILLDPYAKAVFFPPCFDRHAAIGPGSNAGKAPLGVLDDADEDGFDWGEDRRPRHDNDLVVYEVHVRGFTRNDNSGVASAGRGAFAGIIEKIPYLVELGVSAVELMPVFLFDHSDQNYWGYMPLSFFAPHANYASASSPGDPRIQFKQMVKALHEADIEVILDVVYNHTGEGDENGPVYSLKGIDNSTYYIASDDPAHPYADFSGTGNTLHCANRAVRQLIVDSLSYWAREMHVDGFRFDLASVFSRNSDGSVNLEDPAIFGEIAGHPYLRDLRMIAEPWEGNMQHPNYQLGAEPVNPTANRSAGALQRNFPGLGWRQWNDKFRTTVRRFVKGEDDLVGELMTRIYGSADVFPDNARETYRPWQSLNYISSHDGLTLYDLVSYNTDESWNCGERDGEDGVPSAVIALRKQQVKNFCCLLFLANGTPMFRAGDEFLQTQLGCSNAYNIDSTQSWLDWSRLEKHAEIFHFFRQMIQFRKRHPSIGRSRFWREDVSWYGIGPHVELTGAARSLAFCLRGSAEGDDDLYVMINASWQMLTFEIQEERAGGWKRIVDTSLQAPQDFLEQERGELLTSKVCVLQPHSIVVLLGPFVESSMTIRKSGS